MAVVAQLVEHRVVVPSVAGSIPVDRPKKTKRNNRFFFFTKKLPI